jgi:hypothetical protein
MDGADGSQAFVDSSPQAHSITANGNARINTAQSKFGGASGLFGGSGDYLSSGDSADWYFATGDFTIDFWVRFNALPAARKVSPAIGQYVDANNNWSIYLYNAAGTYSWYFDVWTGGVNTVRLTSTTTVAANTWYHVAVARSGSNWYLFQDGSQLATTSSSATVNDFAGPLYIGYSYFGGAYLNGWLDEVRVSKGVARWTSNFTPPGAPY